MFCESSSVCGYSQYWLVYLMISAIDQYRTGLPRLTYIRAVKHGLAAPALK